MSLLDEAVRVQNNNNLQRYKYKLDRWIDSQNKLERKDVENLVSNLTISSRTVLKVLANHGYDGTESSISSWRRAHVTR
ncbi:MULTISPECIES: hypothetical protein [Actinomycetes]|uniref:hypothetical protein n=1 Tax=Actinomycetes TaxID=1760 RepID=UPI00264931F4|nr:MULTISPECIES: hypothetical protein [Actinomycetes]MDN5973412.1 hypothetical protein [Bifidobacterium crudilactis]MDN6001585.1 hypothetical protein [Bifidobacterium crudilactis]MDN6210002.1 hypothetical protein [Bifidobacterium crudilactis]MDN6456811.1 hypothetical protein [Yaniella sp.]MDN6468145.1 hypothetical protein [Bifidobacterium crudilactis]